MTAESSYSAQAPRSLYKYVSLDVLRRILAGSVRFTQPTAFNDPFELLPEIVMPVDEPERRINVKFDLISGRRQPPAGELDAVPPGCRSGDATSRDIVAQLNSLIGFFCLSVNNESLLMWSHYADQYAGAVVEFDASHDFFAHPINVEYRVLRPKRHLSYYLTDNPIPISELCVKSDQWAYDSGIPSFRERPDFGAFWPSGGANREP